jgi:hypothetical protein
MTARLPPNIAVVSNGMRRISRCNALHQESFKLVSTLYNELVPNASMLKLVPTAANVKRYCTLTSDAKEWYIKMILLKGSECVDGFQCDTGGYLTVFTI